MCENHCFEKKAFKVEEKDFTQLFFNGLEFVYQNRIYLVPKYI